MRKALATLLVSVTFLSAVPAPLLAHVRLKSSSPASGAHLAQVPKQLRLDFTETLELNFASLRLISATGREMPLGPLAYALDSRRAIIAPIDGAMDAGTFTLLVKLAILGIVALTGFYNWRFVQPRLGSDEATMRLRRSARVEVGVAVLVLLITAILVASPTSMDAAM